MGAALCCAGGFPEPSTDVAAYAAPSANARPASAGPRGAAAALDVVGPPMAAACMHQLDHPVVMTSMWPLLDHAGKAALRRTCKRVRLAVDCNLQVISSPCPTDCALDSISAAIAAAAATGSGRSSRSSMTLSRAHFPPTWSHITALTLRSMHDVSRIFHTSPTRQAINAHMTSLQTLTVILDKCSQNQLRRLVRLPIALRVTHLQLDNCQCLSGVSALIGCPNLRHLSISEHTWDNRWRDASLDQCTHLISLRIRSAFVSVLPVASAWTRLKDVDVSNCRSLMSLAPLAGCSSLRTLDICSTAISDLLPLASCTTLTALSLSRCRRVTTLAPLAACALLASLDVSWTGVDDLAPLTSLTALHTLDMASTAVSDLSPLSGCLKLQKLDTSFCDKLTGLAALALTPDWRSGGGGGGRGGAAGGGAEEARAMARGAGPPAPASQLRCLDISSCYGAPTAHGGSGGSHHSAGGGGGANGAGRPASAGGAGAGGGWGGAPFVPAGSAAWDLSPLSRCSALETLCMSRNAFHSLEPLSACTALLSLDVSRCRNVACLAPVAACTSLTSLDTSWTAVHDLSPLAALRRLARLDASHCDNIHDLSPLRTCTVLEQLVLRECPLLADLSALANCRRLALLNVTRCNRIVDLSPVDQCGLRQRGKLLVGDDQHEMYWELKGQYVHH